MMTDQPTGAALWVAGARPRTLPAAAVPVAVGTAAVAAEAFVAWRAVAAFIVAIALQIGVNYANDYSDGIRGTDDDRVGPLRLVGSGAASPGAVKRAMLIAFGVAASIGLVLSLAVEPWLLVIGAASVAAGWFYTGGSNPYGYLGLGELFVFVFFGLVATIGSAFVQIERLDAVAVALAVPVGFLATALLVVNNLRDRVGDEAAGKRTLAVRMGDRNTRRFFTALLVGSYVVVIVVAALSGRWAVLLGLGGLLTALPAIRAVRGGADGRSLIAVLEATGRTQLVTGLLLSVGLLI